MQDNETELENFSLDACNWKIFFIRLDQDTVLLSDSIVSLAIFSMQSNCIRVFNGVFFLEFSPADLEKTRFGRVRRKGLYSPFFLCPQIFKIFMKISEDTSKIRACVCVY